MGKKFVKSAIWGIYIDDAQALLIKNKLEPLCRIGCGLYISCRSKYEISLKADESDYGENKSYSKDRAHVFGVTFSMSERNIKKVPDKAKEDYKMYAKPFLDKLCIISNPKLLIINQVM